MDSPGQSPSPPSDSPISHDILDTIDNNENDDLETITATYNDEPQLGEHFESATHFPPTDASSTIDSPVTVDNATMDTMESGPSEPKTSQRKKKSKGQPQIQLPGPLTALPTSTKLPDLEDFNLRAVQLKNPLFVAICKVLIVYGNAWQSAMDLVDGIRHFNLASLGGRTPKGTIQGAISTGLALAAALRTFDPIEKQRMNSTTYYRMDTRALEPPSADFQESDAADLAAATEARRKAASSSSSKQKKRKTVTAWDSDDSMSSDSSDDENGDGNSKSYKRARTGSPSSSSSRSKTPAKYEPPNGLKKLPKGYVYDTEINQSALMGLSINPSQTGEFMEHLRGQQALENDYPDRRSEYGVDLTCEPSMFAVEQQTGYTYPRLRTNGRERLPKTDCEDGYAVADLKHSDGYLGRLYCITDGHGGRACSSFVIATIPGAMQVILGKYRPADLAEPGIQDLVKKQITEAIRLIDKEYLDYKKQQYLLYKAKKIPQDPGSDGTTLIVNIFIGNWIICVNVGDSRSIISSRDTAGRWNVDFHSEDHTPSLERLAQTIYANGGEFVTHDDKVIKFDPNIKNDKKHRQSLKEARIRVKDGASNLYGIPYRTRNGQCASINLGACIGDVLYKLDPINPVLSSKPDITFIDVSSIQHGYLLMASDGLWDYVLRGGKIHDQNAAVSQFVGDKIDRGWNHQRIVCTLSDREGMSGLYSDSIQEYDDFTAILVSINKPHSTENQQVRESNMHIAEELPGLHGVDAQSSSDTQMQGEEDIEIEGQVPGETSSGEENKDETMEAVPIVYESALKTALEGDNLQVTAGERLAEVEAMEEEGTEEKELMEESTAKLPNEAVSLVQGIQESIELQTEQKKKTDDVSTRELVVLEEAKILAPEPENADGVKETTQASVVVVERATEATTSNFHSSSMSQTFEGTDTQTGVVTAIMTEEQVDSMEVDVEAVEDTRLSEVDIDEQTSKSEDVEIELSEGLSDGDLSEDIDVGSSN
ncbi:hypothetical protein BGZ76_003098 [Entomortierella beljakovae]|nr:hypothetical protein BGZ76_003098 [Entomortierella beljakovae]